MAFVLFATFAGLVFLAVGIVGRRAKGIPRCRGCNADVRAVAWDATPRCPGCNADLSRGGSVRLEGGRQRRRDLVAAVVCGALALGVAGLDQWLLAQRVTWRELWPARFDLESARSLNPGGESWAATRSLERRLRAGWLSPAHQEAWLAHLLGPNTNAAASSGGAPPPFGGNTGAGGATQGALFELARSADLRSSWPSLISSGPPLLIGSWAGRPTHTGPHAILTASVSITPPPVVPAWIIPRDLSLDGARLPTSLVASEGGTPWARTNPGLLARVSVPHTPTPAPHAYVVRAWLILAPVRTQHEAEALFGDALRELEAEGVESERDLSDRFGIPVRVVPVETRLRFEVRPESPGEIVPLSNEAPHGEDGKAGG
ncbi:MAG: hypothetical protein JNM94_08670 [Phycisphaerae bacterium]|nr:hypothetical protein [Phycisphaerae bacterium]